MKKIFVVLILFVLVITLYSQASDKTYKKNFILGIEKANNITGYKGDVFIRVIEHIESESGIKGARNNLLGKTYNLYLEWTSDGAPQIIFKNNDDLKDLEISTSQKHGLKVIYDKTDITKNLEKYKKELSVYPYTIVKLLYTDGDSLESLNIKEYIGFFIDYLKVDDEGYTIEKNQDGYDYVLSTDWFLIATLPNYKVAYVSDGDYSARYTYKDSTLYMLEIETSGETIEIEFLNPKGFMEK